MAINEVKGKTFKVLVDAAKDEWHKISFWTKAQDVSNDLNNLDLETCCGNITGITDSVSNNSATVALSATAAKTIQDQITALSNIKSLV